MAATAFFRDAFAAALDADTTANGLDYEQIATLLAAKATEVSKAFNGGKLVAAEARIAALEAELAAAKAAKPKRTAAAAEKPKHGRMQNQILNVNLTDGETVFRKCGKGAAEKTFAANFIKATNQFRCEELGATFGSPSAFAKACAVRVLGNDSKSGHAVNGWDACWVERDGKKYTLSQLRTAPAPPAEPEAPKPAASAAASVAGSDDAEESDSDEEEEEADE
jgi:hypothetical protein